MPLEENETGPDFSALLCNGDVFRNASLTDVMGERGCVLFFYEFSFNAISENWWKRYARRGWDEFDGVPVVGISRDGPYAQNEFIRSLDMPFRLFSDVNGVAIDKYDLLQDRTDDGMVNTSVARRSVYVLDSNRNVEYRWIAEDQISPTPADEVEKAVEEL
ncbi:MAG: redoxin domain-containing protein [Halobacteria archaeon]|nr:redoxin domain-containing protein [Halobacteria archaeon]